MMATTFRPRTAANVPFNDIPPLTMHVDLNSCYAIIEQQANRLLRGKPVGIAAYDSPGGFILSASYEARRAGIGLMRVRDARRLAPDLTVLTPDPEKYFDAHRRFRAVLERYTHQLTPKSIDEFVLDLQGSPALRAGHTPAQIGRFIKQDISESLGEYVTVNVGVGPNRFLAKLAAGLNKPDGLDILNAADIPNLYGQLDLMDLPGINRRYRTRLQLAGIYTPLDFLEAPVHFLKQQVFKSMTGYYWYLRLRGHEVDAAVQRTRSFGNDYAVGDKTSDPVQIARLLMKLCEKTGRRLRHHGYQAYGAALAIQFENSSYWHRGQHEPTAMYTTQDIYRRICRLFAAADIPARVTHLRIAVFDLEPAEPVQVSLFDGSRLDNRALARATDAINDRYGEFTLAPASMTGMHDIIVRRVPFGSVRDI